MTQTIECPHCKVQLTCKQPLAGKTVSCPKCRQSFRVPIDIVPPIVHVPPAVDPRPVRRRNTRKTQFVVAGVTASVILLGLSLLLLAGRNSKDAVGHPETKQSGAETQRKDGEADIWKQGFDYGYFMAGIHRNRQAAGDRQQYDDEYLGAVRFEPAEMAQFRAGYRAGYKKGWEER